MAILLGGQIVDDQTKTAFDFARDCTKQLITLATAIITLEITFKRDFVGTLPDGARRYASFSWLAFLLSVVFGVWTLMALTGTLEADKSIPVSIRGKNVVIPSMLQIILFLVGLSLTVIFGVKALRV
jgi:hypothetical protein